MAWTSVLAIFVLLSVSSCVQPGNKEIPFEISIGFANEKPNSVSIPVSFFPNSNVETERITIMLESAETAIIGDYQLEEHTIKFTPAIPFRRVLNYVVKYDGKVIDQFSIPEKSTTGVPILTNIYPTSDTVPENLLKIHLEFSEPMSERHSFNYVSLLDESGDTLDHIFLRLDPELWNYDHTLLTLWLEPGRIKKSLLPNVLDGIPIQEGKHYFVAVSDQWKSAKDVSIQKPVQKHIFVGSRDENMPTINNWDIELPEHSTDGPLKIHFNEVLDYTSVLASFKVLYENQTEISGVQHILPGETGVEFIPEHEWLLGKYSIQVDESVEDLAANNMTRLFDRDLMLDSVTVVVTDLNIPFEIKSTTALQ